MFMRKVADVADVAQVVDELLDDELQELCFKVSNQTVTGLCGFTLLEIARRSGAATPAEIIERIRRAI